MTDILQKKSETIWTIEPTDLKKKKEQNVNKRLLFLNSVKQ